MWVVVTGVALAGVHEDLKAIAAEGPEVAVACSSAHRAGQQFARLAAEARLPLPMLTTLDRAFRRDALGSVASADGSVALGLWGLPKAPPGPLMLLSPERPTVAISFDTPLALDPLAEQFAAVLGTGVEARGEARVLRTPTGTELALTVTDGRATARVGDHPAADPLDVAVVDRLPDAEGCAIAMRLPEEPPGARALGVRGPEDPNRAGARPTLVLQVPLEVGEPVRFVVQTEAAGVLAPLEPRSHPPVTTVAEPFAVVALGLPLESVDWDAVTSSGRERRAMRWLTRRLPLERATIALFRPEDEPRSDPGGPAWAAPSGKVRFGAELRLARAWSAEKTARKVRRSLRRLERQGMPLHVLPIDDTRFELVGVETIRVAAVEGGLQLASTDALLDDLAERQGRPWLAGAGEEPAAADHLFAQVDAGRVPELDVAPDTVLSLGLRLGEDGVLEGELRVPLTLDELADLAARLRGLGPPRLGGLPGR